MGLLGGRSSKGITFRSLVEAELDLSEAPRLADADARRKRAARTPLPPVPPAPREGPSEGAEAPAWVEAPPRDLFGLALSGGGIRSATFNLGLLQGLDRLGLLGAFDYLSTVSGGGYVGGFWTRWRSRHQGRPEAFPGTPAGTGHAVDGAEPHEIRHLREFGNFLSPSLGFFSVDTGRILVTLLGAMIPSLTAALSFIALAVFAWLALLGAMNAYLIHWMPPSVALVAVTVIVLALLEVRYRMATPEDAHLGYEGGGWWYALSVATGVLLTWGAAWALLYAGIFAGAAAPAHLPFWARLQASLAGYRAVFAPGLAWLAAAAGAAVVRAGGVRFLPFEHNMRVWQTYGRMNARLLFMAVAWSAIAATWTAADLFYETLVTNRLAELLGSIGGLSGLFALSQRFVGRSASKAEQPGLVARLMPLLPQILAYATLFLMSVGVILGVIRWGVSVLFVAAAVTALVLLFLDPQQVGLHAFYRSRLARAFLGASNPHGRHSSAARPDDDVALDDPALQVGRPLHLVCCAANDLSPSNPLEGLRRGAVSATFSANGYSVGDAHQTWAAGATAPTLGAAMTASAAAFNTLMGSMSMKLGPAVTFLMAAFNLRLGLWWPHPAAGYRDGQGAAVRRKVHLRLFKGLAFYRELLGQARADADVVHFSDGGHFENLALYELVRRHCRYVIVSDCGADPDVAFGDFGNAVRRIREDFGVDIEIDVTPLRPGDDGLARQHMVAGDIHYPDGDTGLLLYFKPSLTGDEPVDVTQYHRRNEDFPHETTGDQFYGEAQWESYRSLGEHAVRSALRALAVPRSAGLAGMQAQQRSRAATLFSRARQEWLPLPEGYTGRLAHYADRIAAIEASLREDGCETLLREVYKEVAEIDAQVSPGLSPETERVLRTDELAPAMQAIRTMLLFMEEVFRCENLAARYNQPLYLGLMNYFARWAYAPLFRMWWPLLKTLYPRPFVRFVEERFDVDGAEAPRTALSGRADGYAMQCWQARRGPTGPDDRFVSYRMGLPYRQTYWIQAAQVRVRRLGKGLAWESDDFFVPPGLWGAGIGTAFLDRLARWDAEAPAPDGVLEGPRPQYLVVRVSTGHADGTAARKARADEASLYRAAQFLPIAQTGDVRRLLQDEPDADGGEWLYRPVANDGEHRPDSME